MHFHAKNLQFSRFIAYFALIHIEKLKSMLKNFKYSQVPNGYALCFNSKCKKAEECLRYQVTFHVPEDTRTVTALNPARTSPKGDCQEFMPCTPQKNAIGITHLFDNIPYSTAREIKNELIAHYGKTHYYRLKRKERCFSPEEQRYVKNVMAHYGITGKPQFDSYEEAYNWSSR